MIDVGTIVAGLDLLIADAEAKYHQLLTGRLAAKVAVDGHETEFAKADADKLAIYISGLKSQREQFLFGVPASGAIGIQF